jgi:hypothetical protein
MPDIKFTQLPEIPAASAGDYIPLIDISDDSMSDDGSNVVIRVGNLANSFFTSLSDGAILSSKIQVNPTFTGNVTLPSTTTIGNITGTQLEFLSGLRNNIQYQLDNPSFPPFGTLNVGPGTQTNAPLLIKAGTNTITPTSGAIEYDGTNLYFSDNTPTRQTVATKNYVDTSITNLIGTAPTILDTLGEIADSIADNGSYAAYVNTELAKKSDLTYVDTELAKKSDLTYVDTELAKKSNIASPTFTGTITSGGLTTERDGNVILSANRYDTTAEGPELNLIKTRGTIAAPTGVNNNDELGDIAFSGYTGLNNQRAASIRAFADGAPSSFSLFANQIIEKIDGTPGVFGGTTTITSVDSPSQITITSASANTPGNLHFAVRYTGSVTNTSATTTITDIPTTAGLFVGQTLRKITLAGGTGAFGGGSATIVSIDSTTQITITCASGTNTAGSLTFEYFTTGTITDTDTTTTITGVGNLNGFYVGQRVREVGSAPANFGAGATITSIDTTTSTITISSTTANIAGLISFASGWSGTITGTGTTTTITGINSSFSVPGRLTFNTVAPGSTIVTERMRISSDGTVTIPGTVAAFGDSTTQVATTAHVHAAVRGAVITITGASVTISSEYYNRYTRFTNSGAITITLPSLTGVPVGTSIKIRRGPSAGVITLSHVGIIVNGNDSTNVPQNGTFELKYISVTDGWDYIKYY